MSIFKSGFDSLESIHRLSDVGSFVAEVPRLVGTDIEVKHCNSVFVSYMTGIL
jgi:hypothetical protein